MFTLIVGKPDSGKSYLAESLCLKKAQEREKYYIATMIPFGKEGEERVKKHRAMRQGKGFETLEWPRNLEDKITQMDFSKATVLLECMSNLVGNEMYDEGNKDKSIEELTVKIVTSVMKLNQASEDLFVVTNVFALDDATYDDETRKYVKLVENVNEELRKTCDCIYEYKEGVWVNNDCD